MLDKIYHGELKKKKKKLSSTIESNKWDFRVSVYVIFFSLKK